MSRLIAPVLVLAALVALAPPAAAYPDGERVTFTPSIGYMLLSERSNVDPGVFLGGSVGFMFNRNWGIEGTLGYVPGTSLREFSPEPDLPEGKDVDVRYLSVDLRYQVWHDRNVTPYAMAGWQELRFEPDDVRGLQEEYEGFQAGLGAMLELSDGDYHRVQARLEGRYLYNDFDEPFVDSSQTGHSFLVTGSVQVEIGDNWHRDTDGDGIIDRFDNCPDTGERVVVDAQGCPIDSDQDGVFDGIDIAPDTPLGAEVDSLGTPIDSDEDGVYDGIDQCVTPPGAVVDERGCGIDSDGDTVFDGIDQCPGTPSGVPVDRDTGCPRVTSDDEREFYETGLYVLSEIEFESGSAEMQAGGTALLRPVAQWMRKWPNLKIEVGGHTDDRGSLEVNQQLSQERAQTVVDYMVDNFDWISSEQMVAVGYGEEKPIADNATEEGRTQNRRVEFQILEGRPELPEE
ncbi:MAG TPA: OmpA family protein [Candidatus Krumholzibacteria bacterium]|nr:OmpA family protein [Candidatus Krumholzibacteria bacterium]